MLEARAKDESQGGVGCQGAEEEFTMRINVTVN